MRKGINMGSFFKPAYLELIRFPAGFNDFMAFSNLNLQRI